MSTVTLISQGLQCQWSQRNWRWVAWGIELFLLTLFSLGSLPNTVSAQRAPFAASSASGALFPLVPSNPATATNTQTDSASVAADSAGGMHAAFSAYGPNADGKSPAYYDYCAPGQDCSNVADWTEVSLASDKIVNAVQLALNPQGQPRLLVIASGNTGDDYYYAACDSGCTTAGAWTITYITSSSAPDIGLFAHSKHDLALDSQGQPRFVYADFNGGLIYWHCETDCTNAGQWSNLALGTSMAFDRPAQVFNAAGQPRLLTFISNSSGNEDLDYVECSAADCATNAASWSATRLIPNLVSPSDVPYSALRLTSTGLPRFAYYGPLNGQAPTLYYVWCSGNCADGTNWSASSVGYAGDQPELALDQQDRPRLSFKASDTTLGHGLGYAWCNTACESGNPSWQRVLAESSDVLDSEWHRPPPGNCTTAHWYGGYRSSLALDSAGNPRIGYDAQHLDGGCSGGNTVQQDYETVRLVFFPAGGPSSSGYSIFLPLVKK